MTELAGDRAEGPASPAASSQVTHESDGTAGESRDPADLGPAYYAAGSGGWRDWWVLLHPPYTAWHLSYVVIGACVAPVVNATRLVATVLAFFFAVGVGAHALDEVHGRPLRTTIPTRLLLAAAFGGLAIAVILGVLGVLEVGWSLIPFIVVGPVLVVAYNAELFGGLVHNDIGFAVAWGAFPVLTAYAAQAHTLSPAALLAAGGALGLSLAQRKLSTPARTLRRRTAFVTGELRLSSGERVALDQPTLLRPLEAALRALSWSTVLLAASFAVVRLT